MVYYLTIRLARVSDKAAILYGMSAIVFLESIALLKGFNGETLTAAIAAITALGGYLIGRGRSKKYGKK